jgi:hypothetical protein
VSSGLLKLRAGPCWLTRRFVSLDDDQDVIGPVRVRQHLRNLRRKLSDSDWDGKRSSNPYAVLGNTSSTTTTSHENI